MSKHLYITNVQSLLIHILIKQFNKTANAGIT